MRLLVVVLTLFAAACATPSQVALDTGGLKYKSGGVEISFSDSEEREFISGSWQIDNWKYLPPEPVYNSVGEIVQSAAKYVRKTGAPFEGLLRVDMDNNGRVEDYSAFFTDLELRHSETDGQIWVLMRELPAHRAQVKLDVLVDEYAQRLSFEQYTRAGPFDVWVLPTKKYAARVLSRGSVKFGRFDGVIATIEIANLAQLQLDPKSRMGLVRVLMVRVPGFTTNVVPLGNSSGPPRSGTGLLVVGYFSSPDYFDKGLADYDFFLGQFRYQGRPIRIENVASPSVSASTSSDSAELPDAVEQD